MALSRRSELMLRQTVLAELQTNSLSLRMATISLMTKNGQLLPARLAIFTGIRTFLHGESFLHVQSPCVVDWTLKSRATQYRVDVGMKPPPIRIGSDLPGQLGSAQLPA